MTTITFKTDGTAQHVGESTLLAGSVARATKKRASHIVPANPILRAIFHAVRFLDSWDEWCGRGPWAFGGLTEWTRRWPCLWRVQIVGGPVLPKLYADRSEAIRDEINWLEENRL